MTTEKPTNPARRVVSLLRRGPRAIALRLYDQSKRKLTGSPAWRYSRITPNLYVGGQHYPPGWQAMLDEGITAVVNMRELHHDDVKRGVASEKHLHLATRDNTPPTLEALEQAATFIAQEIEAGGKVYVHCGVGVGRAPSAAAAYLIYSGMTTDEALTVILTKRPFIHLTGRQKRQLRTFEQHIKTPVAAE